MIMGILNLGIFFVSFIVTFYLMEPFIKKARQKGFVVRDMYKKDKREIPSIGGLVILSGIVISLIFAEFFTTMMVPLLIFYFIVFVFSLYGLTDDLFGFKGKRQKVWVLFLLALPIAILTRDTNITLFFYEIELGWAYAFIFAPLYITVVANLINMHSGYNGLSGGLTLILLVSCALKAFIIGKVDNVYLIVPVIGALTAFMYYNLYPARVFLGNIGPFLIGSALGGFIVLSDIEFFGFIILIPHIINFLMWLYWCLVMSKVPHIKFGTLREDGTIKPPNGLTIKYFVTKLFKVNEPQAVLVCYGITGFFCVIGLLFF